MRITHAIVAGVLALTLAACGSDDEGSSTQQDAPHNHADVEFAQQMIPHHRQAVEMADLASSRAGSSKVKSLAADIAKAQSPEIETMTGWLEEWDEDVPPEISRHDMEGQDMGGMDHGSIAGTMSPQQMAKLEKSKGSQFDKAFLTMMIAHHEGAIEMAEPEQESGEYEKAIELAEQIAKTQRAEIKQMRSMLNS